ncbi:hypothetical protein [Nocardia sp. CA-119907]|uniref:hypothetical protein n=1 Tax=Nocardia sp. CA-119907 TaxID=3239973 RepID=UPI003D951EF5
MAGKVVTDAFRTFAPVAAEELVLGNYTFVSYHRTGIAAALRRPFDTNLPLRADIRLKVPVTAASGSEDAEITLQVRGPGDVAALDTRQIIRRFPTPGTANAEPGDLAHIEFDAPDLPWQFTPAGPDANKHLPPWLRLVVVDAALSRIEPATAKRLAVLHTPRAELPPPEDAWAWAHAQVLGKSTGDPSVAARLAPATPLANLSRLIAGRQLPAYRDWIACVVPTFLAGVQAGFGPVVTETKLTYAWGAGAGEVMLPVYDHWTFSTGPAGSFELLAERLWPVRATGPVGQRTVDAAHPGNGIARVPVGGTGRLRKVRGALTRPDDNGADDHWPAATTEALRTQLEAPNAQRYGAEADPSIGPPIYAGAHTATGRVPDGPAQWFRDLNIDPAARIVAGLGTRVVQMDQESLMASAWAQVEGVENTNRALRLSQLSRYVAESLHRRHLARMHPADLLAVTDRVATRVLAAPAQTLRARVDTSVLPIAATAGTLRRLAAPRARYTRFTVPAAEEKIGAARSRVVRALLTDAVGNSRSWVRTYTDPDAITDFDTAGSALIPADLRPTIAALAAALREPPALDALAQAVADSTLRERLAQATPARTIRAALLDALLTAVPTPADIDRDRTVAQDLPGLVAQIEAIVQVGKRTHVTHWTVRGSSVTPFGLVTHGHDMVEITIDDVGRILDLIADWAHTAGVSTDVNADATLITTLLQAEGANPDRVAVDFSTLTGVFVRPLGPRDIARAPFAVGQTPLLTALQPRIALTRRVLARLPARDTWPHWLPQDWFDDQRIESVLAAPRFNHPMYEALDRYDREWLMPGVGTMTPHEMVTLLKTNARFAEAFLIGLNHEFARELVWRGYPTDGRATSFFSFWTPAMELTRPVHALGNQALGRHIDPKLDGAIVLLVRGELIRRYPDVLAHAVTQPVTEDPPKSFARTPAPSLFRLRLAPDLLLVGFDLRATDVATPAAGKAGAWWFTLSEHVGEPRFGLDEVDSPADRNPPGSVVARDELQWGDLPQLDGGFLSTAAPLVTLAGNIPYRADSAFLGWLLFQQPARVAFAAAEMMERMR